MRYKLPIIVITFLLTYPMIAKAEDCPSQIIKGLLSISYPNCECDGTTGGFLNMYYTNCYSKNSTSNTPNDTPVILTPEQQHANDAIEASLSAYCVPPDGDKCNPNEIAKYKDGKCVCEDPASFYYSFLRKCKRCEEGKEWASPEGCKPCGEGVNHCDIMKGPLDCHPGYYFVNGSTTTKRVCRNEQVTRKTQVCTLWEKDSCSCNILPPSAWNAEDWYTEYKEDENGELHGQILFDVRYNGKVSEPWLVVCLAVLSTSPCDVPVDYTNPVYEGKLKEFSCSHACTKCKTSKEIDVTEVQTVCEDVEVPATPKTCRLCSDGKYCPDGKNQYDCPKVRLYNVSSGGITNAGLFPGVGTYRTDTTDNEHWYISTLTVRNGKVYGHNRSSSDTCKGSWGGWVWDKDWWVEMTGIQSTLGNVTFNGADVGKSMMYLCQHNDEHYRVSCDKKDGHLLVWD